MALSPRFANRKETRLNTTAHTAYFGPRGKMPAKVSAQLVTSPTAVLRQASVTVAARTSAPAEPR